jgi:hypothetical protein
MQTQPTWNSKHEACAGLQRQAYPARDLIFTLRGLPVSARLS